MTETVTPLKWFSPWKIRLIGLGMTGLGMVGYVTAIDFSAITNLVDEVILIIPGLVALIIAIAPLVIIGALVAALVGFVGKALKIF